RQTGARWLLNSLVSLENVEPQDLRHREIAARMLAEQKEGRPVHEWEIMSPREDVDWSSSYQTVGQFMSTDLFTVRADDLVDLAASVMDWRHVRHVPVEDDQGRLIGLVTHRDLLHLVSRGRQAGENKPLTVGDIMKTDPLSVSSTTPTLEALDIMQSHRVGSLPVVDDGQLVGILTSFDFLNGAARIFRKHLGRSIPAVANAKARATSA
ncbi:MAG TPA: CBS domain-containing protein, partial [Pyrinomonadaceae bacterium]|nr:CBS domain-containing protein [Pyrinomonadaceae bacterium]